MVRMIKGMMDLLMEAVSKRAHQNKHILRAAQDRPANGDPCVAKVLDFQPNPNEKVVQMVLQKEEWKELSRIREVERKATIDKYKRELSHAVVRKIKGGPKGPSSIYKKGGTTPKIGVGW